MEGVSPRANYLPHIPHEIVPALTAALFISIGYIDPGKWAACIDSGARFGCDLTVFLFLFNFVAISCQYLSAHIGVTSGKNLAQICNNEYDKFNCIILGIQAEISIILSDLTMILGIANGLQMLFGMDIFNAVLLTALNAVLYPLFSRLLENSRATIIVIRIAASAFLCYLVGMLISQPEISVSPILLLPKLSGENVYALMSLLGANIMPHNFYLHSSIVQRFHGSPGAARAPQSYDNIFAVFAIFGGIFLVNYVLMNSAASTFYSSGLVLTSFQDAVSMMEQTLRSPIGPFAFFLLMFSSDHIIGLSWEIGGEGQTILYDYFGIDLPGWLHRASVRIFATVATLYCLWHSGAEGMYQMIIFTQVMVALLLPATIIPLYRVASSGYLMGANKISAVMEFVIMISFMGIIGLQLIFMGETMFGNSDWMGYLNWNTGNNTSTAYFILFFTGCASLCFTCWLFATPLKSRDERLDAYPWSRDRPQSVRDSSADKLKNDFIDTRFDKEQFLETDDLLPSSEKVFESHSGVPAPICDPDFVDTIVKTDQKPYLTPSENVSTVKEPSISSVGSLEQSAMLTESIPITQISEDASDFRSLTTGDLEIEATCVLEKTLRIKGELATKDDQGETCGTGESSGVLKLAPHVAPEGPRSIGAKLDEGGSGAGSLSRISGLGRAARRQLAAILDEFWGQLYDFHGQITQEAKAKKLDLLLGVDSNSKPPPSIGKADSVDKDYGLNFQSAGDGVSGFHVNSNLYDAPSQQRLPSSMGSPYGIHKGPPSSSLWSDGMQVLDTYLQSSDGSALDKSERRYSSLRLSPSSEGIIHQPATLHGYQFPSYLNRIAKDLSVNYMNGEREYSSLKAQSSSLGTYDARNALAFGLSPKVVNGFSSEQTSAFQNLPASRNSMIQSDVYLPDKYTQWGSSNGSGGFGGSVGRTSPEKSLYANIASRVESSLLFDEFSAPKSYRDIFPSRSTLGSDTGSLWHRQPFEQFGVANKTSLGAEAPEQKSLATEESATSMVDMEVKLLQSLRHCILKLLKLEGSEWLFRQNDGVDEDLIDRVAARERFVYEAELRDMKQATHGNESWYAAGEIKSSSAMKGDMKNMVSSVPHCGEGCVWNADLIVSFGVWCIHQILELSLMESRPELWGKYTYVLNRLQGVIDLAFFKPRGPTLPCFCLQIAAAYQQRLNPVSNGALPPTARPPRGKLTTAIMILEIIKDVESAISSRKGRSGTAAGDVAFPTGKMNLASVLKRYKRRLSNKPVGAPDGGCGRPGPRRPHALSSYAS